MSASKCIKCKKMVFIYEKYCDECLGKWNLFQDRDFWKHPESYELDPDDEFENDLKITQMWKPITMSELKSSKRGLKKSK